MLIFFLACLIPFIGTLITFYFVRKGDKIVYIVSGVIIIAIVFLTTFIVKYVSVKNVVDDTEYWGYYYVKAERYEYWSSWVDQTCTRQVANGTDSKGNTTYTTETYDCSYCDKNPEHYIAYDNKGNEYDISKDFYYFLVNKWQTNEIFVELDRNIHHDGSCGVDGDMLYVRWDGDPNKAHSITVEKTYTNKLQAAHTIYDFEKITKTEADSFGLYDYPAINNYYEQNPIIGDNLRRFFNTEEEYNNWYNQFLFLNGKLGNWKEAKIFFILYPDALTQDIAIKQENYWQGGNKNEMNICIGYNSRTGDLYWVRAFSWCEQKRIEVELREDIMTFTKFDAKTLPEMQKWINYDMIKFYQRRHFRDFNYINVDLPSSAYWWAISISILFTIIGLTILPTQIEKSSYNSYRW